MDDNDIGDDEMVDPLNRQQDKNVVPTIQNWQARGMVQQQPTVQFDLDDDDYADLDGASATRAIIPPLLAPEVKFNIISMMIQLLNLKGLFGGLLGDEPNIYLVQFINICKLFDNP